MRKFNNLKSKGRKERRVTNQHVIGCLVKTRTNISINMEVTDQLDKTGFKR